MVFSGLPFGQIHHRRVTDLRLLALVTMRTDSFPQVQNDSVLAALPKDTFTLDKMLEGSYRDVIVGPAALVKPTPLKIDPRVRSAAFGFRPARTVCISLSGETSRSAGLSTTITLHR